MRKIVFLLFLFVSSTVLAHAQKKVVLEKIRCYASNLPIENYLQDAGIIRTITTQLNQTLLKHLDLSLTDTTLTKIQFTEFNNVMPPVQPEYNDVDTGKLHLYLDLVEMNPLNFFRIPDNFPPDSAMLKRARTVFLFKAWFFTPDKKIEHVEKLNVVITSAESPGMGVLYGNGIQFNDLTVLPKVFTEFLRVSTDLLFDPKNEIGMVEMKLQPAFVTDNYILPKTSNQPRTYVVTNKNISSFHLGNKTEMIRMDDPVYEQVVIKGKKAQKYPADITSAIMSTEHFAKSDYVFLRQDCRDVLRDRNYLLKLTVQVDPDNIPENESLLLTNFLVGNFHYLLNDNDTLAKFAIFKNVSTKNELYMNTIGNGYDTLSFYKIKSHFIRPVWQLGYDYILNGFINKKYFSIQCSGLRNSVKEIYVENKLVCIAQGKFTIEKFVVFDASLSPELLNQLFMIGFNRFLE